MTETERERCGVDREKGGRGETARMQDKDRCVTMYGGRVKEMKRGGWIKEGVASEGRDGDKGLGWQINEKIRWRERAGRRSD